MTDENSEKTKTVESYKPTGYFKEYEGSKNSIGDQLGGSGPSEGGFTERELLKEIAETYRTDMSKVGRIMYGLIKRELEADENKPDSESIKIGKMLGGY